jgi:hypothetical protein
MPARTKVISLTIFDRPLTEFQPERLCQLSFPRFNASTVQLFTSPKVEYQVLCSPRLMRAKNFGVRSLGGARR